MGQEVTLLDQGCPSSEDRRWTQSQASDLGARVSLPHHLAFSGNSAGPAIFSPVSGPPLLRSARRPRGVRMSRSLAFHLSRCWVTAALAPLTHKRLARWAGGPLSQPATPGLMRCYCRGCCGLVSTHIQEWLPSTRRELSKGHHYLYTHKRRWSQKWEQSLEMLL